MLRAGLTFILLALAGQARSYAVNDAPPNLATSQNGQKAIVPIYRDPTKCVDERVEDLLSRMTLEEKVGQMFHQRLIQRPGGGWQDAEPRANMLSGDELLGDRLISHFNVVGGVESARVSAEFANRVQQFVINETRLGIPVTLSTDPRHAFTENIGTGFTAGRFSQWPETLGLAAIRDPKLVRKFAEVAKEEYLAIGIRAALHPQVDLATEPRWARIPGTWGEDAQLTSELIAEYIKGFQGEGSNLGPYAVTTVTKHFPGNGPMENGEDSHFEYGKNQTYPGNNFDYHLLPFKAAIQAGARQIMPAYSRPIGTKYEPVGFGFNKGVITDLLRDELGFQGIVVSDWSLITDQNFGQPMPAKAWGVEHLSGSERMAKILDAGCDQIGGEHATDMLLQLIKNGIISEERVDKSVRLLLREKFLLGLFEKPFVDPDAAERIVGNDYFVRLGREAQRRSYTLLTNKNNILPLRNVTPDTKFYIEGFNATYMKTFNLTVVDSPEAADYALLRFEAPSYPRSGAFEKSFATGSLEFTAKEKARQAAIYSKIPTVVDITLNRPGVIPEIAESAAALFGSYGSEADAFLDIVLGRSQPEGKLPFDLPSSMAAVETQFPDVPFDTKAPLFKFGHGLSYASNCKNNHRRQ
ncbi:hypothetical protein FDECE_7774 [Fusarium decemcellulare]|nr:hypothetical protein FDECE_7774 [Fusarium decemcellulare]